MPSAPTVFVEPRSDLLGLPIFIGVVCVLVVGSVLFRGIPTDTATRVTTGVFAVGAVACVFWALRWRAIPMATLSIDHDRIVWTPSGRGPKPKKNISRRPDSRLRFAISSTGMASPTSTSVYILYDEAVGRQPHLVIDCFGIQRVKHACAEHGWAIEQKLG